MPPVEWLLELTRNENGYRNLLSEAGGLANAAWRLARARCLVSPAAPKVPNRLELGAAAMEIAARVGWTAPLPTSSMLAIDCEAVGLPVM
jgi:hypothetical protein